MSTGPDRRKEIPERRARPFVSWIVGQHAWVVPLLAVLTLLGIIGTVATALGFAPLDTTGNRLDRLEARVAIMGEENTTMTAVVRRMLPIIFCRGATASERALVRDLVDCRDLYPTVDTGGPR